MKTRENELLNILQSENVNNCLACEVFILTLTPYNYVSCI